MHSAAEFQYEFELKFNYTLRSEQSSMTPSKVTRYSEYRIPLRCKLYIIFQQESR